MTIRVLALLAVVLALPVAPAGPPAGADPPAPESAGGPAQRIKELQKERIDTLQALVKQTTADWQLPGQGSRSRYEDMFKAQLLLLDARLDAAEKTSERIPIYTQTVETLKQYEKAAQAHVAAGRDSEAHVLRLRAERLGVEIRLERAKMEAKAGR